MSVILIATLDTKGNEAGFVRDELEKRGMSVCLIDAGIMGSPIIPADITSDEVLRSAGATLDAVRAKGDRGEAVTLAAAGVASIVRQLHAAGHVAGIMGLGGSAGTTIATTGMRSLPFGIPKLMISTLASGQVRPFVGPRDIMMFHSVTDISGLNRISRSILGRAAAAMAGMINSPTTTDHSLDRPILTATMFGVTTPCVETARTLAESLGYEVLVFHAVGTGGEAMESLVGDSLAVGVLDITTTELADELVGGVLSAGPDRLTAAGRAGIPQVVSVGALDMVNFGPRESVPAHFADRQFYIHNANVTLMRTTPKENQQLGEIIARKLRESRGPYRVVVPLGGVSAIDKPGQPFWNPEADGALFESLRQHVPSECLIERPEHINDPVFAEFCVRTLQELIKNQ
jgi:uncharacterized protein (UPF0261 family)